MDSLLRVVDLWKSFDGKQVLRGVSLEVRRGEYFVILGPTGVGKTTLIKCIAGLLKPDRGEIYIGDRLVNDLPPEERGVGYFPQFFNLFSHMTVWDNVYFPLLVKGVERVEAEKICREILSLVRLLDRAGSYPHELSGGMQQRVALARAIATGAELLLLDEPLSQLDAKLALELRQELKSITRSLGRTVVHVTNNIEEAAEVADRIAVIGCGRVIQVGSFEEIYENPRDLFVDSFVSDVNLLEASVSRVGEGYVEVEVDGFKVRASRIQGGWKVEPGVKAVLSVRMEDVKINPAETSGLNVWEAEVEDIVFSKGMDVYSLKLLGSNVRINAKLLAEPGFVLEPGSRVKVGFYPSDARLYPRLEAPVREEV